MDFTLDFTLLFISISLNSLGSFLDIYTTRIAIRDLGIEFEANKLVRNNISKHGYKRQLLIEASVIILVGIVDSLRLVYSFFFIGLIFLIVRGLVATSNYQIIVKYRTIGIDAFKEKAEIQRQAFQNVSLMNIIKYILPYLIEALICFIIYGILLTIDFPLIILSRYFVFGLAVYFIATAFYSSKGE